jgi:hypothetical protein
VLPSERLESRGPSRRFLLSIFSAILLWFGFALASTLFGLIPDRSLFILGKLSSLLLSLFGSALTKWFCCFMLDRSSSISGKSLSSSLPRGFCVTIEFSLQILDIIVATENLNTYLVFKLYYFYNAKLGGVSGINHLSLEIRSYYLSKGYSVD